MYLRCCMFWFQFCMLEHFSGKAITLVCAEISDVKSAVEGMSPHALDLVRKIASFRTFVEKSTLEERQLLLKNDDYLKVCVIELIFRCPQVLIVLCQFNVNNKTAK